MGHIRNKISHKGIKDILNWKSHFIKTGKYRIQLLAYNYQPYGRRETDNIIEESWNGTMHLGLKKLMMINLMTSLIRLLLLYYILFFHNFYNNEFY